LAVDTETMGLNVKRDRLCVLQLSSGNKDAYLVRFDKDNYQAPNLKKLLMDENRVKLFHFARFDLAIIKQYLGIELTNIYCTKIASKLSRTYTDSHGLKELCRELLSVQLSKQQQSSDWGGETLNSDQCSYAANDVLYLHRLREKLDKKLKREGRLELAYKTIRCLPTRVDLDLAGFEDLDIFAH
jgi:ribonuclease D